LTGKSITELLKEKQLLQDIPEDILALIKKSIKLEKHMEENKQDMTAKRGILLATSKIMRLVKYYKSTGRLPKDWKFDKSKLRLMIE
jgi:small subunit ribosomal protein S15